MLAPRCFPPGTRCAFVLRLKLTYILNRYPAVSITFIQEEIAALRNLGFEIHVISVRRSEKRDAITDRARREQRDVSWLVPASFLQMVRTHLRAVFTAPSAYLATLRHSLQLAPRGAKGVVWQVLYFGLAIEAWRRAVAAGSTHLHTHFSFAGSDISLLARDFAVRTGRGPQTLTITMHGSDEFADVERTRIGPKVREADAVIAISNFTRGQIFRASEPEDWPKVRLIHCGIDLEFFTIDAQGREGDAEPQKILTVGRLVPAKGVAVLVEAISQLSKGGRNLELTIVGTGPAEDALRKQVETAGLESRVYFTGAVGGAPLRELLAGASLFCLPSFAEGLPVVLMEALALRIPVVCTGIMGIPELVIDGLTGRLVAPTDSVALAAAIGEVLDDGELRRRLSDAGRSIVEEEFDIRRSAQELADLFYSM